ncbi:MAG TPA: FkbM family methyltransferase [Longilinea sp.]|nr:FkbM family methyltransferase [Longilinea sp.]
MAGSISGKLIKGIEYLAIPFQFPRHGLRLTGQVFSNRKLIHEIPRLIPYKAWFKSKGIRTIVDIGGFVGSFAYAMRMILPETQIYSFEPLVGNFQALVHNLEPLGRFKAFNTALGGHQGTTEFWQNDFTASSSVLDLGDLHKEAFPYAAQAHKITVPMGRLDDFLPQMTLETPVLLKIDVQGYEMTVLEYGLEVLKKVHYVIMETSFQPLYAGQPLFHDIELWMEAHGFRFAGDLDTLPSPKDGTILQADSLFIRK